MLWGFSITNGRYWHSLVVPSETCLDSIPETERTRAMKRFWILQPFLEEGISLVQGAGQHRLGLARSDGG
jgi:hypothetical protein